MRTTVLRDLQSATSHGPAVRLDLLFLLSTSSCFCRRWTCDRRWDKRKHNATTRGGVHIHSGCRPHWAALRGKLRLPHPKPLTSSTLQTCPLGKWWCVLLTTVTWLASVEQRRPRREADRIGHQIDGNSASRASPRCSSPEAVPEEPEEQRVDVLQVVSEPNLRWSKACLNVHHFDSQTADYLERVMATTTIYPRLFEISSI